MLPDGGRLPQWLLRLAPPHPQPRSRARRDQALTAEIGRIHRNSGGAYGAPRIHAELQIACGIRVGRKRVARLMRGAGLVGCHRRRRWRPGLTRRDPKVRPAPDLVNRHFTAPRPDRVWHGDLTELPTLEGKLYLAVLLDGCSRLVVGHAIGEHGDAALTVGALELAIGRRGLDLGDGDGGLICHTDQGSTYTAVAFSSRLERLGIRASMGSVGDCFDHALVESWNATLECELIDRRVWQTRTQAHLEVFYWIEATYNRTRRHSRLGYLSPVEYEATLTTAPTMSNPST